tara:strand:+ start:882 stop:1655 length:774 start_codon:yes stop_codon:yes gene_type:complete
MKVVILAGGFGTRLSEETTRKPKPMIKVGSKPIIWHIMKNYSQYGFKEFVVALGYKAELLREYFLKYKNIEKNIFLNFDNKKINQVKEINNEGWKIHLIDTGINTQTGGRLKKLEKMLKNETFMLTYGDGLSNINFDALLKSHKKNKKIATVSAVHPPARFGDIKFEKNTIIRFREKSQIDLGWINGGFMVLEPKVFSMLNKDTDVLEVEVLEKLAKKKKLNGYKHKGFWQCMDTLRDKNLLQNMWKSKKPLWKNWK